MAIVCICLLELWEKNYNAPNEYEFLFLFLDFIPLWYNIKKWHTSCHQPQQILSIPSTHATYFGSTDRPQALNTLYL
jgi:hypothetical protein